LIAETSGKSAWNFRSWLNTIQSSAATLASHSSSVVSCENLNLLLGSSWYSTVKGGRAVLMASGKRFPKFLSK
jgi:hypothetical protein